LSWCVKVDTLGRLCDDNLGRLYNHFTTTNVYLIRAAYNSYFLIIYKPLSLIISPWTFSMQLGAGTAWFCLSQCAIPFCTLSLVPREDIHTSESRPMKTDRSPLPRHPYHRSPQMLEDTRTSVLELLVASDV